MGPQALPKAPAAPRGDEFAALYHEHFSYVWHTLRRLGVPSRELFDVTQNVFIVVHNRLPTYDPSRPLRPWLFGVAFRVMTDYMRLARHARETPCDDLETLDQRPSADELLVSHEERRIVSDALAALDLERRAVVVAHDFDGVSGRAVAEALGIPLKTMYYRLRTGRAQFVAAVRRIQARARER